MPGIPGGTTDRGYGSLHQRTRRQYLARFVPGTTLCCRCQQPIQDASDADLDHDETDPTRTRYLGLSHSECNRRRMARVEHAWSEHGFHDIRGRWNSCSRSW